MICAIKKFILTVIMSLPTEMTNPASSFGRNLSLLRQERKNRLSTVWIYVKKHLSPESLVTCRQAG